MFDTEELRRLVDYTVWANHRVLRAAATLDTEAFRRDLGSSHGGVRGTLAHTMGAEWIWLERWKGFSPRQGIDESEFADVVALRDRWAAIDAHRQAWLDALPPAAPAGAIRYRNLQGIEYEAPLGQLVQHVANHSTYHRGQVITLLRQLGARAVGTDMVTWDRERAAARERAG